MTYQPPVPCCICGVMCENAQAYDRRRGYFCILCTARLEDKRRAATERRIAAELAAKVNAKNKSS